MDHYVFIISKGALTEAHQTLVVNHVKSLLPTEDDYDYCWNTANHIAPLLQSGCTFVAVLNTTEESENLSWNEVLSEEFLLTSLQQVKCRAEAETSPQNMFGFICMSLNELASQLPSYGSNNVEVIVSWDVLDKPPLSTGFELVSALHRLQSSHRACIVIFGNQTSQHSEEWLDTLDAKVLEENTLNLGPVLWRGCIELQAQDITNSVHCQGLELQIDHVENKDNYLFWGKKCTVATAEKINEILVTSPVLQAIDECSFSTIPPYLISPIIFKLCISEPNMWNEDSQKLINHLSSENEVALILRLGVLACTPDNLKSNKYAYGRKWRKNRTSSCISHPDSIPTFEKFVTFVATKSKNSANVIVYPLRDLQQIESRLFNVALLATSLYEAKGNICINDCMKELLDLQYVEESVFLTFLEQLKKLRLSLLQRDESNCTFVSVGSEQCLIGMDNRVSDQKLCIHPNLYIIQDEMDPSDWPERIVLLQKQIGTEDNKNHNALKELGPKLSHFNVSLSSQDIRNCFQKSGEAKCSLNCEPVLPLREVKKEHRAQFVSVLEKDWPEAFSCTYDDIYYNYNVHSEEKESIGNQMVHLYVHNETASTCNQHQLSSDSEVTVSIQKPSQNHWNSPTPRKRASKIHQQMCKRLSLENKSNSSNEVGQPRKLSTSFTKGNKTCGAQEHPKKTMNKNLVPIRFSPRKRKSDHHSHPSVNRNASGSKSSKVDSKRKDIPELLKKKLRVAVVTALESHGIFLNEPFFKPCGKRLFAICQAFVQDIAQKKGSISQRMQKIADAHVKQVIEFEKQKEKGHC